MLKITFREIRYSLGRFMAILLIVALGVGFFAGLKVTDQSMVRTANRYLTNQNFYDYHLVSTIGYDEDAASQMLGEEGVTAAEGEKSQDLLMTDEEGETNTLKVYSLPGHINTLRLTAGRYPESADECLVDRKKYDEEMIGKKLIVSDENEEDSLDHMKEKEFTVTGLVASPLYIYYDRGNTSIGDGSIDAFAYVMEDAFDMDYDTGIYVTFEKKEAMSIYSDAYQSFMDDKEEEWKALNQKLADDRYARIYQEAEEELEETEETFRKEIGDAEQELADAKKELEDAKQELADAKQELEDGKKEVEDGEKALEDGKKKIKDSEKLLEKSEKEYKKGLKEYTSGKSKYDAGKKEYDAGKKAYDEGKKTFEKESAPYYQGLSQYEEGKKAYDKSLSEYETSKAQFDQAKDYMDESTRVQTQAQLDGWKAQLDQSKATLDHTKTQLDQSKAKIEVGEKQLASEKKKIDAAGTTLAKTKQQLDSAKKQLDSAKKQIDSGKKELKKGKEEITKNEKKLADAKKKLEDGEKAYQDGLKEYEDGQKEYDDGYQEYLDQKAEGEEKIQDAKEELADLEEPDTYLLGRDTNVGYASFENDSNIVGGIAKVFPIFFFLVAALVCMTTMTRMMEEQRTQIGVYKALGYSDGAVLASYLLYSGLAAMTGGIGGFFLGTWIFPITIWSAYGMMYDMGGLLYTFDSGLMVISILVAALCSMGATMFVCVKELQEMAASLMRPKAPKIGKRVFLEHIPFIWNRLRFLDKVSLRNLFRYKKRFFMMIIGISGCTALLVTGFGIRDSITSIADKQFGEILHYDYIVGLKDDLVTEEDQKAMTNLLEQIDGVDSSLLIHGESVDAIFGKQTKSVSLVVTKDAAQFQDYVDFHTNEKEAVPCPGKGQVVISAKLAEHYKVKVGDSITLQDTDFHQGIATVSGIFENYFTHYVFMGAETYEGIFGQEVSYNQLYVNAKDDVDLYVCSTRILEEEQVSGISVNEEHRQKIANMMSSMNYVVILVIVSAGLLAFVVIYNLNNINITERIREIATIKVLGFYMNETKSYIFRENVVLTLFGGILGLFLGHALHAFVMAQIDLDAVAFDTKIHPLSYILGLILTFVFNALVNRFMTGKIDAIDMAESLKSVE